MGDMSDFDFSKLQPFIFILLGVILLLIAIFKRAAKSDLKTTGLRTEGIVYALGRSNNANSDDSSNIRDRITVRFATNKKEWITGDIKQDFAVYFTKQYKEGETVDIYYDPANPSNFFVDTKQSGITGRILLSIIGLIFCAIGLYKLFIEK